MAKPIQYCKVKNKIKGKKKKEYSTQNRTEKSKVLQTKAKRIQYHQPALKQMPNELLYVQNKKKTYKNKPKIIKKMVIGTYISLP